MWADHMRSPGLHLPPTLASLSMILHSHAHNLLGKGSEEARPIQQVFSIDKHVVSKDSGADGGESGRAEGGTFPTVQQMRAFI